MLADSGPALRAFREAVDDLLHVRAAGYRRLWAYYRNPMRLWPAPAGSDYTGSERPYRQAQEWGLPPRITGEAAGEEPFQEASLDIARKEVVIENDIGWRIDTNVDFLFGRSIVLDSAAPDQARAAYLGELLRQILANHGGLAFLQRMSLIGAVYGSVDVLVKLDADRLERLLGKGTDDEPVAPAACNTSTLGGTTAETPSDAAPAEVLASLIHLELVEPARALPLLAPRDVTEIRGYAQVYRLPRGPEAGDRGPAESDDRGWLRRLLAPVSGATDVDEGITVVEIITPRAWQVYHEERLVDAGQNPLGVVPLVHVQNLARPFEYEGGSDVEPLIPLQDELNTRLSDRANRVALQSMKMYLGNGIEGFGDEPVQPGRMWSTDNLDARVTEFGGDASAPSEEAAIREIREAMDKTSGVNPVASGAIRNRVGNLTSAAALRLTFQSLLARTERKRSNYGAAIERICELALTWLDAAGVLETAPSERRVRITWPPPIPPNTTELLEQARMKQALGIAPETVRRELGY